ncbi:MAG: EAL domain-containing protein [Dechloromonas sp.]|nr:EAL domain-containing protein [Dechloromonas sp.]
MNSLEEAMPPISMNLRWWTFSSIALVMGVLLSLLTYLRSEAVLDVARPLIDRDLPTLRVIAELKGATADSERIASEFYNSTDRDRFRARVAVVREGTAPRMQYLRTAITDHEGKLQLDVLEDLQRSAEQLSGDLDRALDSSHVDIAKVRTTMERLSANATALSDRLDVLASGVQAQAENRGEATTARLRDIIFLVAVFSVMILLATLVIGYFVSAYLKEAQERRRLALFPERNPNPVISLHLDGTLAYANPGAVALATSLEVSSPTALLPDDLMVRTSAIGVNGDDRLRWEYAVGERIVGIVIHRFDDLDSYHVYLSDITERKRAEAQLEFQAFNDILTGLPNRRRFQDLLGEATTAGRGGAILLISVDRFQALVNTLGHGVAELVLRQIAERLAPLAGSSQIACCIHRFDGDLFAALLPRVEKTSDAADFAARAQQAMASPFVVDGRELFFALNIGIASFPDDGADAGALLRNADTALQQAKRFGGGGAIHYLPAMNALALERLEVEHSLRRAVERGEFELFYQPQVELESCRIIGVEALIRWRHPIKGMISPADFIPVAEETGLINELGNWVLATACAQLRDWQDAGLPPVVMAVNISPRQFVDPDLERTVRIALNENGLEPHLLELEVTEGAAMHDVGAAIEKLQSFKKIGVRLSIDDFGTGYSSLAYLKRFPIDKLKIDQSFVRNMTEDASDAAIARAVIALGHSLGLAVIAEGVETDEHRRLLGDYGCEEFQGYLFSRPKPAGEVRAMLEKQRDDARNLSESVAP